MMQIDKEDARRIQMDAATAEDMMQRVYKETEKPIVGAYYIKEKAQVALRCVQFILECCDEWINKEEEA